MGGDCRLTLNAKGVNKYHCMPEPMANALFRGSCTCNIPTAEAFQAAEATYTAIKNEELTVGEIMEGVRSRIKVLYKLPAGTEIFLCPSGSDAEYIPLLIAKTLNKGRKVVNIVTCDSEDKIMSQPLEGLAGAVECVAIPARCTTSSTVVDSSDPVQTIVDRCAREEAVPIVHCVHGSKTGIVEPFPDTNFGKMVATRDAFIVVDACQGRFTNKWLQNYIREGAMVLITGSKFFRGAPFSGAVLVPGELIERLARTEVDMPEGLAKFITQNEVPAALPNWRETLSKQNNVGRREHVLAGVAEFPDQLERFDGGDGCTSIVSIRLKKAGGGFLKVAEAKKVFEWMTQDLSNKLVSPSAAACCYIGQPVSITKEDCIVRLALGSDSLRDFLANGEQALAVDSLIIQKLALLTDKYLELSA
eukprot:CAMPEP_0180252838 /NCGR_PEP_ID=MMETSP0987-20121128/39262_1 /TAXON_ID=697907 /ORGANISM="non described non described, Strain CCMP2293" /LENGTH=417 /DNA_ID=CAMNT_0022221629 /DNA_START=131 /DNA_END=1384 /DNA_ORIENTATION=-